jgi:YVTN family beta-propeller protein
LHRGPRSQLVGSASIVLMIVGILSVSSPRYAVTVTGKTVSDHLESPVASSLAPAASVWVATNQLSHGNLEPVTGSGTAFDVEVGDLLYSFASTAKGQLGLATDSDGQGSSQAFLVTTLTRQVVTLSGSFTNLEGSAIVPDDQWGYLADQGFTESAALDAVNLETHEVYSITSLPGFSPALSSVAACTNNRVVATDNGDNQLDIFTGISANRTNPEETAVSVGSDPVAVGCSGHLAYIADEGSSTVTEVNVATASVVSTIAVGTSPDAVAVGSKWIYVANEDSDNVSLIPVGSSVVKKTVGVGAGPDGVAQSGRSNATILHSVGSSDRGRSESRGGRWRISRES